MKKTAIDKKSMRPTQKALGLTDMRSDADKLGSYTGKCSHKTERPVQDADDL